MESQVSGDMTPSTASPPVEPVAASQPSEPAVAGGTTPEPSSAPSPAPTADDLAALPKGTSIPYDRWYKVNERMKQAEARTRGLEEQYGDVLRVDPQVARAQMQMYQALASDPVGTAAEMVARLMQHPQYGGQMAAAAARWAAQHPGQAPPQGMQAPVSMDPDLVAENGEGVYSAKRLQQVLDQQAKTLRDEFAKAVGPLQQSHQAQQQQARQAQMHRWADEQATRQLDEASAWYGWDQHKSDVAQALSEHPANPQTGDPGWTLPQAYLHVLHTKILPTLSANERATVVADMQQRAAAATLNPATGSAPQKPKFSGDREGFKAALEHFGK